MRNPFPAVAAEKEDTDVNPPASGSVLSMKERVYAVPIVPLK